MNRARSHACGLPTMERRPLCPPVRPLPWTRPPTLADRLTLVVGFALLVVAGLWAPAALAQSQTPELLRVKVHAPAAALDALDECGAEVLAGTASETEILIQAAELADLTAHGLRFTVLERGVRYRRSTPPGYVQSYAEMITKMQMLAASSPIAKVVNVSQLVGQPPTAGGQQLHAVKISDNVDMDEDEVNVMVVSAHHANEIVTPEIALHAIKKFVELYPTNPRVKAMVDEYEIWIAPVWNPDGYDATMKDGSKGRLNGASVNLNRNYPIAWSGACGGPDTPGHSNYRGPSPASEVETQTMMAWSRARRFAKVLDFHTRGRQVLFGYASACHKKNFPFTGWMEKEALRIWNASKWGPAVECKQPYARHPSADGEHQQWQFAKMGAYSHLVETYCVDHQPAHREALAEAPRLWPLILYVIERPLSMYGHVVDAYTGMPVEAEIKLMGVNFQRGEENFSGGMFGRYHMVLPPKSYMVQFSAAGYETQTIPLMVADNKSSTLMDIRMTKPGQPPPPPPTGGIGGGAAGTGQAGIGVAGTGAGTGQAGIGVAGTGAGTGTGQAGTGLVAGTGAMMSGTGAPMPTRPLAAPPDAGCGCRVALGAGDKPRGPASAVLASLALLYVGLRRRSRQRASR